MAQETQAYKRSLSGSVGAGLSSVFSRAGRTYYILEHKVSSKYHKAGEAQEIIVDQIEIGRDSKCQVQYDESFQTVSRRHAAIVRDGENWKLVQLSQTNKTLLNGHEVQKEWYLQNGDEIQLSINGPKLGFIIPTGNKSKTGSIGLSRRLSLFRQQALKPYKTAMAVMSACIALLIVGGVGYGVYAHKQIGEMSGLISRYRNMVEDISKQNDDLQKMILIQDSITREMEKRNAAMARQLKQMRNNSPAANVASAVEKVKPSVFYIETYVMVSNGSTTETIKQMSSCGTGFLLDNGTFVTARHCVEPWLYNFSDLGISLNAMSVESQNVYAIIVAYDMQGNSYTFKSTDFAINRSHDEIISFPDDNGNRVRIRIAKYIGDIGKKIMNSSDWASVKRDYKGNALPKGKIHIDKDLSVNLPAGTELHVLGFPAGLGVMDSKKSDKVVEPIYNSMKVARDGLNSAGLIMVSQGFAHGNSGGPVFALKDGNLYAIGVVSKLMSETQRYNSEGVLTQQQQQYDEAVPIKYISY